MGTCEQCGGPLVRPKKGRPPTRFCTPKCKDQWRAAERRRLAVEAAGERHCLGPGCGNIIPPEVTLKAKCCSRECRTAYENARRADARKERWRAEGLTCQREGCGGPIPVPETGQRRTKYCSAECKKAEMDRRWRERHSDYNRLYLYGVTPEQWQAAWDAQGGRCAICRRGLVPGKGTHADHDHVTGRFRGILDDDCNLGLGKFRDDPALLRAAAAYLEAALVT